MAPPTAPLNLDVEAISGICGSISIACWVVVFSPQIVENFRRASADGLSVQFIVAWLLGDVFNVLGAVLQGVLPTMVILAVYYTVADVVLLGQCFYYRGFTLRDGGGTPSSTSTSTPELEPVPELVDEETRGLEHEHEVACESSDDDHHHHDDVANKKQHQPDERTALLTDSHLHHLHHHHHHHRERRGSDWSHLSPVVPLVSDFVDEDSEESGSRSPPTTTTITNHHHHHQHHHRRHHHHHHRRNALTPTTRLQSVLFNGLAILMVCAAGVAGWWLSRGYSNNPNIPNTPNDDNDGGSDGNGKDPLEMNAWGQAFGWLCAALYLGSRLPQLLLNWRRKSTEGVSMLFFLFACLGNLTYVLSICAFAPRCAADDGHDGHGHRDGEPNSNCAPGEVARLYGQYILVNLSWLAGSAGTLLLDLGIFVQFFMYGGGGGNGGKGGGDEEEEEDGGELL